MDYIQFVCIYCVITKQIINYDKLYVDGVVILKFDTQNGIIFSLMGEQKKNLIFNKM